MPLRRLIPTLAVLASLAWPGAARAATPEESPRERTVYLLYTGFTGGLSSGRVEFAELTPLYRKELPAGTPARDFTTDGFRQDNAFRRGPWLVYTSQGPLTLEDFRGFFAAGPVRAVPLPGCELLTSDYSHLLDLAPPARGLGWGLGWLAEALRHDGGFPDARRARGERWRLENAAGVTLQLLGLDDAGPPPPGLLTSAAGWEMLPAGTVPLQQVDQPGRPGGKRRLLAVGRPLGDGLRRAALQRRWRDEAGEATLALDLGNMLDAGFSDLSLAQRAFTMRQLGKLGLDGLVPGETELALEPADWAALAAQVPIVAANLEPADPAVARPAPLLRRELNGLRVAVIGLVDDAAAIAAAAAGPRTRWKVGDPIAAAEKAIAGLAADPPDLTILATNVRDDRLQRLRHLDGAAAVLGDMVGLPGDIYTETVALAGTVRARVRSSYLVARSSPNRVGRLEARFVRREDGRPALASLRNEARLVTDLLPYDEALRAELNEIVDRHQRERRALILPDPREAAARREGFPLGGSPEAPHFDRVLWSRLVANRTRLGTGAEVAIVRVPTMRTRVYGPISRLIAESWLEVGDRLVQVLLPGKALKALAAADASRKALAFAGFDPLTGKALGQPVVDDELYRVTTSDVVVRHPHYGEFFGDRPIADRWRTDAAVQAWLDPAGEALTLRDHVVRGLLALKERHRGAFGDAYVAELAGWLVGPEAGGEPRWSLRLDEGELLGNMVRGANDPAFAQVRHTRVTAPSSQVVGGKARVAMLHDSPDYALENRARAVYKRTTLVKDGREVVQETDDELVLTSELRMKRFALELLPTPLTPFWSWNYTTEFRPDEAGGLIKPRRQELAAIWGLLYAPGGGFKELRAGAAFKNDLANPAMLEPGLHFSGGWEGTPAPAFPAKLRAGVEAFRYFATPTDTPDRLGLTATLTGGVVIPLWERFTLNLGADWFVFQGKVPATERLGSNLDFKVGLGYALVWKPVYGVWF